MNFNKYKYIQKAFDVNFLKFKNIKRLLVKKNKSLGKSYGSIATWHRGGGVKRAYRKIINNTNVSQNYAILRSIEYDPNRSAYIGVIQYKTGAFSYTVVSSRMQIGDIIYFSSDASDLFKKGDSIKLRYAPIGLPLYNLEKIPGSGPVYSRSGGVYVTLLSKSSNFGKVLLPSQEEKLFDLDCLVTIGRPSNLYNKWHKKYKAGTNRLLNWRPTVRGTAMNPIDHPHGGGQGKTAPGRPSVSPWGKLTKGVPTRNKKIKNKFIVKRR